MPLTTLNKVVSTLLQGGLVLFGLALAVFNYIHPQSRLMRVSEDWSTALTLLATLLLLPVVFFLGVLADAIGEVCVRRPLRPARMPCIADDQAPPDPKRPTSWSRQWLMAWPPLKKAQGDQCYWREAFRRARRDASEEIDASQLESLAVAWMFRFGSPATSDWVIQHYSLYRLCTNYVAIMACGLVGAGLLAVGMLIDILMPGQSAPDVFYVIVSVVVVSVTVVSVALLVCATLLRFALIQHAYVYECVFREAYVACCRSSDRMLPADAASAPGLTLY